MKYELIKKYTSDTGKVFEKGRFIDIGSQKATRLKQEGYIASDAEPIKPKIKKKPKKASEWFEDEQTQINN